MNIATFVLPEEQDVFEPQHVAQQFSNLIHR